MGGLGLGAILLIYFFVKMIGRAADAGKDPEDGRWTDPPSEEERSPGSVLGELSVAFLFGIGIALLLIVVALSSI